MVGVGGYACFGAGAVFAVRLAAAIASAGVHIRRGTRPPRVASGNRSPIKASADETPLRYLRRVT